MTQPYHPSKYHGTLGIASAKAGPISREEREAAGVFGPFDVGDFLFCFADPDQWAQPGDNRFSIDLAALGLGPYWTVSASVTELSPPSTPWRGDASFETLGVQLNQPAQLASVYFNLQWDSPLPFAVMMTIGYTGQDR